jgi:hypothetical protein
MTAVEKPVYIIGIRDGWLCVDVGPNLVAALAFAVPEDAQAYLQHEAERTGTPAALYRVVEYAFSGNVMEGTPKPG